MLVCAGEGSKMSGTPFSCTLIYNKFYDYLILPKSLGISDTLSSRSCTLTVFHLCFLMLHYLNLA